jgi:hypothetical protein
MLKGSGVEKLNHPHLNPLSSRERSLSGLHKGRSFSTGERHEERRSGGWAVEAGRVKLIL